MKIPSETWTIKEVTLSRIDWEDRSCRMTYGRPVQALACSIEAIGLLNPPVLQKKNGERYRIVSGFRRLQVLQRKGQGTVRCRIAPVETEEKDLLFFNFQENLDRGFNPIEQAWVLSRLSGAMGKEALIRDILPLMGLPPKKEMLDRQLQVTRISPVLWPFVMEGRLFPEIIQELLQEWPPLVDLILSLFILFRWSFQKQKEFLQDLLELSRRRGQRPGDILLAAPISRILSEVKGTAQQKGEDLRKSFRNTLFPLLTKTETLFTEQLSQLGLDHRTRLKPPAYFEGGIYGLEIKFSGPDELKSSLEKISRALALGKLDHLP